MATCYMHHVKFYDLSPRAITCFCYEKSSKKLALSRNDNSIEIWNIKNTPFLEQTIPGNPKDSIESLLWINQERLISTGLRGVIIEYDFLSSRIRYETALTGGAAWCCDINPQRSRIAVGTEDGYINTFSVTVDNLIYEKIFDKQKGRILCLKWDNTGDMIYTGSSDTVRVWNANSGHAIYKMTTGRKHVKKETIVWCLGVTNENNIISGDSRGVLSVWDQLSGTLIESHESHTADILALAVSQDSNIIYTSGIDPVIRSFTKVVLKSSGRAQWVKGVERRLHLHDVRALVEANGKLYSGGVDGYLAQSSYPPKVLVKFPPLLPGPSINLCRKSRCILLRYVNYLELWRLGSTSSYSNGLNNENVNRNDKILQLQDKPMKLLELHTKKNESIISYAITKDSKLIIYSTENCVKAFHFDIIDGDASLTKDDVNLGVNRVEKMLFSPNNKILVAETHENEVNRLIVFHVENKQLKMTNSFETRKQNVKCIRILCFSPDSKYLVVSDYSGQIVVYICDENFMSGEPEYWSLPNYNCSPTAMAVQQNTLNLIVIYSDHKIIEYNLVKRKFTKFSTTLESRVPAQWFIRSFPIINIMFDPNDDNAIIFHDDTTIYVMRKDKITKDLCKIAKTEETEDADNSVRNINEENAFHLIKKYKHLVHLEWLKNGELVAVEVNPMSLTEKLPPTLKQKSFAST